MRKFDSFNQTVDENDKEVVKQCLRDEIELTVDEFDRVWTEGGMYIADAVDAPENGIGFEVQISNAASALGKKGGASKSPAKQAAVRENGKLGGRPQGTPAEHITGYHVYLYGEKFWHRTLETAMKRVQRTAYCESPQIIEVATGKLVYGNPE